VEGFQ